MRPRIDPSADLLALAGEQAGVLSASQTAAFGLTRHSVARLLDQGHWTRLSRGVVWTQPLRPAEQVPWLARAWGGILVGGPGARLGPLSSGFLHGLTDQPPHPDVFVGRPTQSAQCAGPWTLRREQAGVRSARALGSPPRLSVEATVIDLCDIGERPEVVGLLTSAVQRRLTTGERLLDELDSRKRHRHRLLICGILGDVDEGAESPLELGYLRDVERPHGLPTGRRQRSRAGLRHVTDVGYDEWALLVELDGRDGHVERGRFRDRRRDNAFAVRSLLTLRYGWFDVTSNPCAVAWQVATVLRQRGWRGDVRRCGRCRALSETDLDALI